MVHVERFQTGDELRLVLSGELDTAAGLSLRPMLESTTTEGIARVLVDMTELTYMNSTGLGGLVALEIRVKAQGGQLQLDNVPPRLLRVFQYAGLHDYFRFDPATTELLAQNDAF